jgi:hypothetical protein
MPIRKQDYHPDWTSISLAVRSEANNCCEWCGATNGKVIQRLDPKEAKKLFSQQVYPGWDFVEVDRVEESDGTIVETSSLQWKRLKFHKLTKIILTVAHLDRNSHNNERTNLAALCQRCHLKHDIHQHIANRKYGRHHTKEQQLKLELS